MKALPLLLASAFGTREELEQFNATHKALQYEKELFEIFKTPAKLAVPVALTVFEAYYKNFDFYKYLDEYTFEDKIFIFDAKTLVDNKNHFYQASEAWLPNLKRTNNLRYFDYKNYASKHNIKEHQHINWIDGNSDLSSKLRNILKLDLSNISEAFEPKIKKISFEHNWYADGRINLYSSYFLKNDLKNHYHSINYGKHKYDPRTAKSLFNPWISASNCNDYSAESSRNLRISTIDNDGYDGICNGINFWGTWNLDFTHAYSRKWTTPYVAYRRAKPRYWEDEYYYYSLGGFENNKGFGSNLNQSYNNKTLWQVNYDDIFVLANPKDTIDGYSKLQLGLNFKKIKNYTNFLKVSHLLDFTLNISVNGVPKVFKFNFDELMQNKNVIDLKLKSKYQTSLFSDISLIVSKRAHANDKYVQLFNKGKGDFRYSVDISELIKNEQIVSHIEFSTSKLDAYYPSEMLDKDKLKKFFFITNGKNKKSNIPDEILDKLDVRLDFDDVRGILSVKYYDFLRDLNSEGYVNNMKIIPHPKDYNISSLANAKEMLKSRYKEDTTDYLWNSIDFVPNGNDYDIVVNHKNPEVKEQWETFFKEKTPSFSNKVDLSLIPLYSRYNPTAYYDSSTITALFKLSDTAHNLGLSMNDYKFVVNRKSNNETEVRVLLNYDQNGQEHKGEKVYLFKGKTKINLDLVQFNSIPEPTLPIDEKEQGIFKYAMMAIGGVLATSVSSLGILEVLKILNRRKIL
ncbi:hypothetical protein A6V39_01990 [Candidatus Mycoplasma haematobovis]|uniref:Uncharacterized protein n=1 Tax=Candidatus Mycoplasma haematobovis TaxID=432608 RepID=A0A1A9QES2_9MOLU|nr:hypothetical protein [Candidatus Mycoplasma haematobovis]OAL10199.1 hypothetical protein A6V39_01990 [Candidatus Mycoplasma haematobovis]